MSEINVPIPEGASAAEEDALVEGATDATIEKSVDDLMKGFGSAFS